MQGVDQSPPPILQWFESSYQTIESRLADIFMAGYGFVWLPPPYRADQGGFSVGYDVYDRFDLGKPANPTLYGTEDGLKTLATMLHRAGVEMHVDYIINHNGFSNLGTAGFAKAGGYRDLPSRCQTMSTATSTPPLPAASNASAWPV